MNPTLRTRLVSSVGLATNWRLSTVDNQTHPDWSFDRQRFLYGRLSICFSSCIFHSCIFHHCYLFLLFPLLHIPPVRSTPDSSTPAISTPAVFSCSLHSCIFHSRIFSAPDPRSAVCLIWWLNAESRLHNKVCFKNSFILRTWPFDPYSVSRVTRENGDLRAFFLSWDTRG